MGIRKSKRFIAFLVVIAIAVSLTAGLTTAFATDSLEAYAPTTEYMENPLGVGRPDPVFSWKIQKGQTRGVTQASYRLVVSGEEGVVWDTGTVLSGQNNGVRYGGSLLRSGKAYSWTVDVTDNQGGTAQTGGSFGMGLLTEADWGDAQWISSTGGKKPGEQDADIQTYTAELSFELSKGSLGLLFGRDAANGYMWQLNTVQSQINRGETDAGNVAPADVLLLRPHKNVGGTLSCMGEYVVGDSADIRSLRTGAHTFRLEVNGGKVTAWLDGEPLDYGTGYGGTPGVSEDYLALPDASLSAWGGAGFRVCYTAEDLNKDGAKIDRMAVKDGEGRLIYFDDFAASNSLTAGTVEGGKLVLEPTEPTPGLLAWPKESDDKTYSVQTDVRVDSAAAGLIFGAQSGGTFYMWQLNTFNHDPETYLRPHVWKGEAALMGEINIDAALPKARAAGQMNTMRVDVDNGNISTYVNGKLVDSRQDTRIPYIGNVGFRQARDAATGTLESATFDNVMLRDAGGRVVYYDDFENGENPYGGGIVDEGEGKALKLEYNNGQEFFQRGGAGPGEDKAQVPLLMKEFATQDKKIARATAYASAQGHYELNLNGQKVGDSYLAPGWTEYAKRIQYQAYDVTAQLEQGAANRLGAMLAPGWYSGNISILGPNIYGTTQSMIANLVIEYEDGEVQNVVTDGSWVYSLDGPIMATDMFDGETYDANREQGGEKYGWTKEGYDASGWGKVGVPYKTPYGAKTLGQAAVLSAQIGEEIKKIKTVEPVSVNEVAGKWIVDMGQNFAGIVEFQLKGRPGETATIRYGEMLNDSEKGVRGCDNPDGPGSLYTENLRSAKATDRYIFKSDKKETWEPTFTFHGFRYIELSGCEKPALSDITGYALASVSKETGSFTSSNDMLNKIYKNVFWGQRSNFLTVPTDCPQRDERMGWGADTHVFTATGLYNMDSAMFYQKWLQDVRDGQGPDNLYHDIAPNPHNWTGSGLVWSACGVVVPYQIWQMTGDARILSDGYDSMNRYMRWRLAQGMVQDGGPGDWLEPVDGASNPKVANTTYLAYQCTLMAEMAGKLGKQSDAEFYRGQFEQVKKAFHKTFVQPDGTIDNGIQSNYVLALGTGVATPETEPLFAQKLADRIAADGNVMSAGFVSVNKLMPVLSKYGYNDVAYMLADNTKYPSWGYSIEQGATTIWERWNGWTVENGFGPASMNSFNHYSFGSVCEWFYSGIGGIKPDPAAPGFENIIIEPELDNRSAGRVENAAVSYDSVRGEIRSAWSVDANDTVTLDVTVPANATATVRIPTSLETVKEGAGPLKKPLLDDASTIQAEGVVSAGYTQDGAKAEIQIGSGSYTFTYDWQIPAQKSALNAALQKADKAIDVYEDYTDESVTAVKDAVTAGKAVLEDAAATQEAVDGAAAALDVAVAALAPGGNVNLAAGKTATGSSQVGGSFVPQNLTDGKRTGGGEAAWSSDGNLDKEFHKEWVRIDLGGAMDFNRLLVFPRNDPGDPAATGRGVPRDFTIQVSADGETWKTVVVRQDYPEAGKTVDDRVQRFILAPQKAQYIKIDMTRFNLVGANDYRGQLAEIEVYDIDLPVGKADLQKLVDEARKKEQIDYTDESWTPFAQALDAAAAVLADDGATGDRITGAYNELSEAMANLKAPAAAVRANWIWAEDNISANNWTAFRKTLTLDEAPAGEVNARISADSKYWLYVNGELVVFEGGLKRGPNPTDSYVDTVNIAPYLVAGENTIAIQAFYFGKSGYSHNSSGQAGLFFEADPQGLNIISNESWKAKKLDAYGTSAQPLNYRLVEPNLLYDAQKEVSGWQQPGFDDRTWANANILGREGAAPWNKLHDRPIPLFAYDKDYRVFPDDAVTAKPDTASQEMYQVPADEYVIETTFRVNYSGVGVVFGAKDSGTLNMWQVFCSNEAGDPNTGQSPYLKPHVKVNDTWDTPGPRPRIENVGYDDRYNHDFAVRVVVQGGQAKTYVDGTLVDTRAVTNQGGGVGLRADNTESGTVKSFKVSSIDGQTVYVNDDFTGALNFSNAALVDGKLQVGGQAGDLALYMKTDGGTVYECELPVNVQFTPYLKVNAASAGKTIGIYTDKTNVADGPALRAEYVTKAGEQSYESLVWMNGEKLFFVIPDGVTVEELGYRQSGYAAEFSGSFTSDDEFMNTLWTKSRDTLYVTMRDNYMDCPDRERAQWWGDAVNGMQMAFYALSPEAGMLAKKGIGNVLGYAKDGVIPSMAPSGTDWMELPAQSLAAIMSFYLYYEYTGDSSVLADAYQPSCDYLMQFDMGADGVVEHRIGSWDWSDWGSNADKKLITNAWYYIALDRALKMAEALGVPEDDEQAAELGARKASIEANFDKVFWNVSGYYRTPGVPVTDDRGNAMAVFAGLAPAEHYPQIRSVLTSTTYASPYMEKYVLEALYRMGYEHDAMARMNLRYADMVESGDTTLWEFWDPDSGTQNHAWTGGPLTLMSMYAAGVAPTEPGYGEFRVAPRLGTLKTVEAVVPTVKGDVAVNVDHTDPETLLMSVTVPQGAKALVGVPLIGGPDATAVEYDGSVVWENGEDVAGAALTSAGKDERFVYFEASADISLAAKRGEVHSLDVDVDDRENMTLFVDGVEKAMPYHYAYYAAGSTVELRFLPKYDGEYAISELAEAGGALTIDPAQYMAPDVTMDGDYQLNGKVEYVGPENLAKGKPVTADSPLLPADNPDWGANNLTDGVRTSQPGKSGFSTVEFAGNQQLSKPHETVIDLGEPKLVNGVYAYPRTNAVAADGKTANYPQDFTIQVSEDGQKWATVVAKQGETVERDRRGEYTFAPQSAQYVKLCVTKLGEAASDESGFYRLQLAEIEVYGETRTAQEIADGVTALAAPAKDAAVMPEVAVPAGFTAAIESSSDTDIVKLDGTVTPPEDDTVVTLVYKITRADGDLGYTAQLPVTVPGATPGAAGIAEHPQGVTRREGETAEFTVTATGTWPHYQWQKRVDGAWEDIPGATAAGYTTETLYMTDDGAQYRCGVTNKATAEPVWSDAANVTVTLALASAQEIADGITAIAPPGKDQVRLAVPGVPPGYTIQIESAAGVPVAADGAITPPDAEVTGTVKFKVVRVADGDVGYTAELPVTVPAKTAPAPGLTARQVADGVTAVAAPGKDAAALVLPGVPAGFSIQIKSADPAGVIGADGSVAPPAADTAVTLVFTVTNNNNPADPAADTQAIPVTVPAKTATSLQPPTILTKPAATGLNYGQALSDSALEGGKAAVSGTFEWKDGAAIPGVGQTACAVVFRPADTANYAAAEFTVLVDVAKAAPKVENTVVGGLFYGQKLSDGVIGATVTNPYSGADVAGVWSFTGDPAARAADGASANVKFLPNDTGSYNEWTGQARLSVAAATPLVTVAANPAEVEPGGTSTITVTVKNPYDASFTDGLPTPTVNGVTLTKNGTSYTGAYTAPGRCVTGSRLLVEASAPEVTGKYVAQRANTLLTVLPALRNLGGGNWEADMLLPDPVLGPVSAEGAARMTIAVPGFGLPANMNALSLRLETDANGLAGAITQAQAKAVDIRVELPAQFAGNPAVSTGRLFVGGEAFRAAAAAGKSLSFTVVGADGTVRYAWDFGAVTGACDMDLSMVARPVEDDPAIAAAAKDENAVIVSFRQGGALPCPANVTVNLDGMGLAAGRSLFWNYYNPLTGALELAKEGVVVGADGTVTVPMTHCSDYVLTTEKPAVPPADGGNGGFTPGTGSLDGGTNGGGGRGGSGGEGEKAVFNDSQTYLDPQKQEEARQAEQQPQSGPDGTETIVADDPLPEAPEAGVSWAVFNLIAGLACAALAILALMLYGRDGRRQNAWMWTALAIGVAALVCLLATQRFGGAAAMTDRCTPLFAVLLAGGAAAFLAALRKNRAATRG